MGRTWFKRIRLGCLVSLLFLVVSAVTGVFWLTHEGPPWFGSPETYFIQRVGIPEAEDILGNTQHAAYTTQTVRLRSSSGLVVHFTVRVPTQTQAEKLPTMVVLGGHRTGKDAVHLLNEAGPHLIAALDYPFEPDRKMKGLRVVKYLPAIRRALYDTAPAVTMVVNYLQNHARVDMQRLELVGVSLGAPLVGATAAMEPRFKRVWAIQGGGDVDQLLDHSLKRRLPNDIARWPVAGFAGLIIDTLEPERWVGRITPRSFIVVGSRDDERIPRACVESLYNAAAEPKELIWTEGSHVRADKKDLIRQLFQIVTDRIESEQP